MRTFAAPQRCMSAPSSSTARSSWPSLRSAVALVSQASMQSSFNRSAASQSPRQASARPQRSAQWALSASAAAVSGDRAASFANKGSLRARPVESYDDGSLAWRRWPSRSAEYAAMAPSKSRVCIAALAPSRAAVARLAARSVDFASSSSGSRRTASRSRSSPDEVAPSSWSTSAAPRTTHAWPRCCAASRRRRTWSVIRSARSVRPKPSSAAAACSTIAAASVPFNTVANPDAAAPNSPATSAFCATSTSKLNSSTSRRLSSTRHCAATSPSRAENAASSSEKASECCESSTRARARRTAAFAARAAAPADPSRGASTTMPQSAQHARYSRRINKHAPRFAWYAATPGASAMALSYKARAWSKFLAAYFPSACALRASAFARAPHTAAASGGDVDEAGPSARVPSPAPPVAAPMVPRCSLLFVRWLCTPEKSPAHLHPCACSGHCTCTRPRMRCARALQEASAGGSSNRSALHEGHLHRCPPRARHWPTQNAQNT
mmetsp:Transcript_6917/g.22435  ORF Transcript_6917/g.22435 Transcript_6917/m.22435 type:complete len:496 (-) Transcript_6917:182-1669(-)